MSAFRLISYGRSLHGEILWILREHAARREREREQRGRDCQQPHWHEEQPDGQAGKADSHREKRGCRPEQHAGAPLIPKRIP